MNILYLYFFLFLWLYFGTAIVENVFIHSVAIALNVLKVVKIFLKFRIKRKTQDMKICIL